jgi:hypothetical protein
MTGPFRRAAPGVGRLLAGERSARTASKRPALSLLVGERARVHATLRAVALDEQQPPRRGDGALLLSTNREVSIYLIGAATAAGLERHQPR